MDNLSPVSPVVEPVVTTSTPPVTPSSQPDTGPHPDPLLTQGEGEPAPSGRRKWFILGGIIVVVIVAALLLWRSGGGVSFSPPKTNYVPVYTLVSDKVSMHGAIVVNLPKGVAKDGAEKKVTFEPQIKGEWLTASLADALIYKPSEPLALGKHYLATLATADGVIKKDFLADEDPAVISVFPDAAAEAELNSAVTIVFNRPMVPLTTLSELDKVNIPVTLTPATPGKWKWISTRTLQFVPSGGLYGSAHYSVAIGANFVSVDGLAVPEKSYSFTTKALRLDHASSGTITYNQPIQFFFNQPVDLARTMAHITVRAFDMTTPPVPVQPPTPFGPPPPPMAPQLPPVSTGPALPFEASYGTKTVWDEGASMSREIEDKSIISIVPKNDLRGHANVWDFSKPYTAVIDTVYPVGGDITLGDSAAVANVMTTPVLQSVTVESDNTNLTSTDLFDPTGTTTFAFYEDIDIGKSAIQAKGLKSVKYGTKCQSSDDFRGSCVNVEDKSQLVMSFDPKVYARGERVPVSFEKLVNAAGYQVNAAPLVTTFTVYPELQILSVTPPNGSKDASVSDLVFCTNVPLAVQDGKEFYKNFTANKYIVFGRWDSPYLEYPNDYQAACAVGQFVNRIHYGILPLSSYTLHIALTDVFGQKTATNLALTTGPAPKFYLRLQSLQKIYNVTTPEHTKLTFATENFDYVNAYICKVSPDTMVRYVAAMPSDKTTESDDALNCTAAVTKRIPLKTDQWVNQFWQLNIKDVFADPRGQYVISLSHPQYRDGENNRLYARTYLSVTNLVTSDNRVKWSSYDSTPDVPNMTPIDLRGSVFWVSEAHSMAPRAGATVALYQTTDRNKQDAYLRLARTGSTNDKGLAELPLTADVVGATITSGDDSAIVTQWTDTLGYGSWQDANQDEKVYLYTDRPIYRPGQQVFVKGLYRVNFDGILQVFTEKQVEVMVRDSSGTTLLTQKVPVSAYGTFSTNLTLPKDAPLGTYSISARNGYAMFDVQEYVGAAFETTAQTDKDEYMAGDTATISASGKYYFGVPLDGGTMDYSITSQNFYFDRYSDEYFNFGGGWYNCYDCGYGDTYIKSGKATLGQDGTTKVSLPLDFKTLYKGDDGDQSKIMVFHGTIKDKQGKSISFQKSFIVHRGDFYLGVKTDPSFSAAKQPVTLRAKTVDVQGKPMGKSGLTIVVNKVEWPSAKRQEVDGGYYNRPERLLTPVITKHISTNGSGDYSEAITLSDPGEYEIDAQGEDGNGNIVKSQSSLYVYGEGTVDVQPTNNATLNLTTEKSDVKVGEMAKFIIENQFPHAKALVSIQRGRIFTYELIDLNQSIQEYKFPVTEEYAPNIFATVTLLSPGPEVKYGQVEFTVDRKSKALTIDVQTEKKSYLPGEKVNLMVRTSDASGKPVPASVSIAVADVSVLALKGNPKKDPLVFFYDGYPLTVTAETNVKNLLEETPIPTGTKGGDGGNPADLATRKRGEFRDTAFWQAELVTDDKGMGETSFTLPDNLTKWQIESVGITKDTKLGVRYQEIIAQKELMTVPIAPRFVVPGDEFMIGAKIFNQTASSQSLSISLDSKTLLVDGDARVQRTLKAGDTATVYFKVKAPLDRNDGVHTFTLSAKNDAYNDTVDKTISITRNMTYESTATAGSTVATSTGEYLYLPDSVLTDRGGVTIKTSATLAVYLSDAIKYLFEYPYGCSEQLASKLSAIAVGKRALAVPNVGGSFKLPTVTFDGVNYTPDQAVQKGLDQIYANQTAEGGFSYYKGLQPSPYLTMSVLGTLADLRTAGYKVNQSVIDQAVQYVHGELPKLQAYAGTDTLILLAYTLSRVDAGSYATSALYTDISNRVTTAYLSDKASSNTLGYLALIANNISPALKEKVYATLMNRVDIDSRGAYIRTNPDNMGWEWYETPEKDTALFIKALVADHREYSEMDNMIRWLIASRSKDGSWGSTNTSVAALDALTDYLVWKRETESNFTLTTALDGKDISKTTFGPKNVLSTIENFLSVKDISPNLMHALSFTKTVVPPSPPLRRGTEGELPNKFYYDLSLKYYLPVDHIAPRDEGIAVTREFYAMNDPANAHPLGAAKVGDVVRGVLTMISPKERHFLSVEDYIPAGFELVNFGLATEDQANVTSPANTVGLGADGKPQVANVEPVRAYTAQNIFARTASAFFGWFGSSGPTTGTMGEAMQYEKFHPDFEELRDDRVFAFAEDVRPGTYTYEYYLRATTPGTFSHLPAVASELYFPENFGRTGGSTFTVSQ